MRQVTCEMCGSTDMIKQDGVFVCRTCGMKYSVEEAKKMMIEGTVEVTGTVNVTGSTIKVDNAEFVDKYLQNARRAKQKEDWEEVEKYYNMVEQYDPSNIEAIFYSAYGKARLSMVDSDIFKRRQICDVFCNSISIIDDNYSVEKSEENQDIVSQMNDDLFSMYRTSFVYTEKTVNGVKSNNTSETYILFAKMAISFIESVSNIIKVDDQIIYRKMIYEQLVYLAGNKGITVYERNEYREMAIETGNKINELDPSFEVETIEEAGGCYIATAVYGSYDCPQVWTLRRYRDYTLAETWYGKAFIHTYYAISPMIVKWFGHTEWFKKMWQCRLDRMVKKLNDAGIENTPYEDRTW